jgi:hypothetical protein
MLARQLENKIGLWKSDVLVLIQTMRIGKSEYLTDSVKFVILDQIDQQLGLLHSVDSRGGVLCV